MVGLRPMNTVFGSFDIASSTNVALEEGVCHRYLNTLKGDNNPLKTYQSMFYQYPLNTIRNKDKEALDSELTLQAFQVLVP